jgi:hypothetical protein
MGVITENHRLDRSSTESFFTLLPIYTTLPWTELAIFKDRIGLLDPLSQFPFYLQSFIGWNPFLFFSLPSESGSRQEAKRAP